MDRWCAVLLYANNHRPKVYDSFVVFQVRTRTEVKKLAYVLFFLVSFRWLLLAVIPHYCSEWVLFCVPFRWKIGPQQSNNS